MSGTSRQTVLACVVVWLTLFTADAAVQAQPSPEPTPLGRWITASGNLEVEIAPCGAALCGTVTRVLANHSMSQAGQEMHPVDARPALGMSLLKDLVVTKRAATGPGATIGAPVEWRGEIYNRENGKTYACVMSLITQANKAHALEVRPYWLIPLFGKTQVWQRAAGQSSGPDAPTPSAAPRAAPMAAFDDAPEFAGVQRWFNSPALSMSALRGRVVLVDFWTRDCGNCIHTLPQIEALYQHYKGRGLVVVGVHTPETTTERDPQQVSAAIQQFGLHYPVAMDNDYQTWSAWRNVAWPTVYLVSKQGKVIFKHLGEGDDAEIEQQVKSALE